MQRLLRHLGTQIARGQHQRISDDPAAVNNLVAHTEPEHRNKVALIIILRSAECRADTAMRLWPPNAVVNRKAAAV